MLLLAEAGSFGGRDMAALLFIAVAIVGIWIAFRHMQDLTEQPKAPGPATQPIAQPVAQTPAGQTPAAQTPVAQTPAGPTPAGPPKPPAPK